MQAPAIARSAVDGSGTPMPKSAAITAPDDGEQFAEVLHA
jgi:hypothetical protein